VTESAEFRERWDGFLTTFFGSGNELDRDSHAKVREFIRLNERGLEQESPGPFILPHKPMGGSTSYFAVATNDDQAQDLRRLLNSCVGPTFTTFSGRPARRGDQADQVHAAALDLAGSEQRLFHFEVVKGDNETKKAVQDQVLLVLSLSRDRPERHIDSLVPIGRLLRDFERATDEGDESTARGLLFGPIFRSGRLSGINRIFLQVRFLAGFSKWKELESLPALTDVLRTRRPALVSDALCRLALRELAGLDSTRERVEAFSSTMAPRFGNLVESIESIRSSASAEYYVLWQLSAGANSAVLANRLDGLAWGEVEEVRRYLALVSDMPRPATAAREDKIADAIGSGQFDLAVELLRDSEPIVALVPALVAVAGKTLSASAIELVSTYRDVLGGDVVDEEVARQARSTADGAPVISRTSSWAERVRRVEQGTAGTDALNAAAEEDGLLELLSDETKRAALVGVLEATSVPDEARRVIDAALKIVQRLDAAVADADREKLRPMRWATIELWSLGEESGDQARAASVLDEIEILLMEGCSLVEYHGLVELVSSRWDPLLTDVAFGLGVRAIEVLLSARPGADESVLPFALRLLGRVTPENVHRLESTDVLVADLLSRELALGLDLGKLLAVRVEVSGARWEKFTIGLYSLDEAATQRATQVLTSLLAGVTIRSMHDKVASPPLRAIAGNVDLMVVATRVAKHAATDAIREERGARPMVFAAGKGSSSLVRAALDYLSEDIVAA
jgi:hypothetical protein